ncbi:hypothetical protein IZ6_21990 [Terrihabitans soli]|uniref:DUF6867 domain-containing protein n=1 Tax=Terrihabitans soli TaxID=708113 RepID=A0A6S6QM19_9HYPH|nr:hypothetical protein [Terrihabitans soli]BCJ91464.1 hypothetical protein IZ6_21990 [Terrihabitans soli]
MGVIWEVGIADFIIVTILLGGGAAFMTGRAVANGWEPLARAVLWMVPLTAAVRFIHFALFHGTLLSWHYYLVDFVILMLAASFGHRLTRTRQMTRRYGWVIEDSGFLSWRLRR